MKYTPIYGAIVIAASAFFTLSALAIPVTKVHMLENLSPEESQLAQQIIEKKGYKLSRKPIFNESSEVVVITKAIGNESEPASVQVEIVHQEGEKTIPKTIFNLKLETKDVVEVLDKLPSPEKLKHTLHPNEESIPVAFQN